MTRKLLLLFVIFFFALFIFPNGAYASTGSIPPTSKLYFLQTLGESVKLYFTRDPQQKFDYLLTLTERRVDEAKLSASNQVLSHYQGQINEAASLAAGLPGRDAAVQKITDASLRQQATLAQVYARAPNEAKEAILGAQTESSKHVANTIQTVGGTKPAEDYSEKVQVILRAEQIGQVEQVPMEGAPSGDPSDQNINPIKSGQGLNQLNPINDQNGGSGGMQPAAPIQQK